MSAFQPIHLDNKLWVCTHIHI